MPTTQLLPPAAADTALEAGLDGFLLAVPRRGPGRSRVYLFENGMLLTHGLSKRRPSGRTAHHWGRVESLGYALKSSMEHDVGRGSVVTRDIHVLCFSFAGERPVEVVIEESPVRTLDRDFFERGVRSTPPPDVLAARHAVVRVRKRVAEAQAPAALRTLRGGGTVDFGRWRASAAGLVAEGRTFPWDEVALPILGLQPSPNRRHATDAQVVVYLSADRSRLVRAPDTDVPDLALLCLVATELAPEVHRERYEAMFP